MRDYVILTDSCCDFSQAMVEELGVQILPLSFIMEGQEYKNYPDNREMDPGDFYARLRGGALGSTSAARAPAPPGASPRACPPPTSRR